MLTITTQVIVTPEHRVIMDAPIAAEIEPGVHDATVGIYPRDQSPKQALPFVRRTYDVQLLNPSDTFRREDMYGDNGR